MNLMDKIYIGWAILAPLFIVEQSDELVVISEVCLHDPVHRQTCEATFYLNHRYL